MRYPLLEITTGLIFLAFYLIFGLSWYVLIAIAIYIYLNMSIGYTVNKRKMMLEELDKLQNEENLSPKAGVFITEIVIYLKLRVRIFHKL